MEKLSTLSIPKSTFAEFWTPACNLGHPANEIYSQKKAKKKAKGKGKGPKKAKGEKKSKGKK